MIFQFSPDHDHDRARWESQKSVDNQIDFSELCKFSWFILYHKKQASEGKKEKEKDTKLIQIKSDLSRINFDGKKSSH